MGGESSPFQVRPKLIESGLADIVCRLPPLEPLLLFDLGPETAPQHEQIHRVVLQGIDHAKERDYFGVHHRMRKPCEHENLIARE